MNKTPAIIVDIDGTLANNDHRLHFLDEGPDWEGFNSNVHDDKVNEWCKLILEEIHDPFDEEGTKALLVTGRNEEIRDATKKWLDLFEIQYHDLLMRKSRDRRPDYVIKKEIYYNQIEPKYNVLFAIDDRKSVVEMWRGLGLVCLQCKNGNY